MSVAEFMKTQKTFPKVNVRIVSKIGTIHECGTVILL